MAKPIRGLIQDTQVPEDVIEFFSFEPPQKSRSVSYDDVAVRGRSEPYVFYSYTGAQIWSFTINFLASFDQADGGTPLDVQEKMNFIESFVMPDYGQNAGQFAVVRPPHLARIRILKMLDIIGTIRDPSWTYEPPYDINTGQPYQITCSFTFNVQRELGKDPLGYADIRRLTARGQDRFRF